MLKKTTIVVLLYLLKGGTLLAQDIKKDVEKLKTKMDLYTSKTGSITKFIDIKLPNLKGTYGGGETRIRKIISGNSTIYFYQIVKSGKYGNSTASIEYTDLLEVIKALQQLRTELSKDVASKPDYLENKFTTVDGFELGYYVSTDSSSWYVKLEKYDSDSSLFIENGGYIESAFIEAMKKIDELKK
jgi:hypothetical protein